MDHGLRRRQARILGPIPRRRRDGGWLKHWDMTPVEEFTMMPALEEALALAVQRGRVAAIKNGTWSK